jgi:hypothetical protein
MTRATSSLWWGYLSKKPVVKGLKTPIFETFFQIYEYHNHNSAQARIGLSIMINAVCLPACVSQKMHFSTSLAHIADSKKPVAKKMYFATIVPHRKIFSPFESIL